MITPQTALLVGILAPLAVACSTPFLANRPVWRDAAGPIGVCHLYCGIAGGTGSPSG